MAAVGVQRLSQRIFTALGIPSRQNFAARLVEPVAPVVLVPTFGGPEAAEVADGFAYSGAQSMGPTGGELQHIQLFNPANSGLEALVWFITHFSIAPVGGTMDVRSTFAQLNAGSAIRGRNKRDLAAVSACQITTFSNPAIAGGAVNFLLASRAGMAAAAGANQDRDFAPQFPWRLPPGTGILTVCSSFAAGNGSTFHWNEYPLPATA